MDQFLDAGSSNLAKLLGSHRAAEIVALSLATVLSLKEGELLSRLHALGNDPLLEALAHADHCADDRGIVGSVVIPCTNDWSILRASIGNRLSWLKLE